MLDLLPSTWDLLVSLLDGLDEKTGNLPEVRVRIARVDTVIKLAGA
jgi:ribosomal protein L29